MGQDPNSPYGLYNGQRCHMCLRTDSLHKVMERLANPGIIFFTNKILNPLFFYKHHMVLFFFWVTDLVVPCLQGLEDL